MKYHREPLSDRSREDPAYWEKSYDDEVEEEKKEKEDENVI
jgi:hypothetical protein